MKNFILLQKVHYIYQSKSPPEIFLQHRSNFSPDSNPSLAANRKVHRPFCFRLFLGFRWPFVREIVRCGREEGEGRGGSSAFNHSSNYSPEAVLPNYLWCATDALSPSFLSFRASWPPSPPSIPVVVTFWSGATIEELKLFELAHGAPNVFNGRKERTNVHGEKERSHRRPWFTVTCYRSSIHFR